MSLQSQPSLCSEHAKFFYTACQNLLVHLSGSAARSHVSATMCHRNLVYARHSIVVQKLWAHASLYTHAFASLRNQMFESMAAIRIKILKSLLLHESKICRYFWHASPYLKHWTFWCFLQALFPRSLGNTFTPGTTSPKQKHKFSMPASQPDLKNSATYQSISKYARPKATQTTVKSRAHRALLKR